MFDYRNFLMLGFKSAVGKMADHQIIFNANGFYEDGVFTEDDLEEIEKLIKEKNADAEKTYIFEDTPLSEEEKSQETLTDETEEADNTSKEN